MIAPHDPQLWARAERLRIAFDAARAHRLALAARRQQQEDSAPVGSK